jgi:hypothetical protein
MKISVTIDILPSEVFALLEQIQHTKDMQPDPEPEPEPEMAMVADNAINRDNAFWKARIGEIVRVIEKGPECWTVQTQTDPIPLHNIEATRFRTVLHR